LPFLVGTPELGIGDLVPPLEQALLRRTYSDDHHITSKPSSHWLRYEQWMGTRKPARCSRPSLATTGRCGKCPCTLVASSGRSTECGQANPPQVASSRSWAHTRYSFESFKRQGTGRRQPAKDASLLRLVIRGRQVRGGRADLVQGNGMLSCVGWCRGTRKTVVSGASRSNYLALFLMVM
jgi:hypothetical protein